MTEATPPEDDDEVVTFGYVAQRRERWAAAAGAADTVTTDPVGVVFGMWSLGETRGLRVYTFLPTTPVGLGDVVETSAYGLVTVVLHGNHTGHDGPLAALGPVLNKGTR